MDYHCIYTWQWYIYTTPNGQYQVVHLYHPKWAIPGSGHSHCCLPDSNLFWSCQEGLMLFRISFSSTHEPCVNPHKYIYRYTLPSVYHLPTKPAWQLPLPSTNTSNRHKSPSQPPKNHSPAAFPLLRGVSQGSTRQGRCCCRGRCPHHLPATLEGLSLCRSSWCCHHPRISPSRACDKRKNKTKACENPLETQLIFYYGTRGISVVTAKASHGNKEALSGASVLCLQNTPTQA